MAQIHEMKEKLKQENDALKKLKQSLKDVQEKQKNEKEVKWKKDEIWVISSSGDRHY